jgi:hypothetical protein
MERLTVGTRLWVYEAGARTGTPPAKRVVVSVGRKWAALDGSRDSRVTADPDERGLYWVDRGAYSPAQARTDAQLVAGEHRMLLREPARLAADRVTGRHVDPDILMAICRLLGVEVPDELPTEAEVLAKYGVR